jgi:hypothetical protein
MNGEEVLSQHHILESIAVIVGHGESKRGRPLGFAGKETGFKDPLAL